MKKLFLALAIVVSVVSAPVLAQAQDKPKVELFGGYSYQPIDFSPDGHGWNVSVVANVHRWFGVKADVSGHYLHTRPTIIPLPPLPGILETRISERIHTVVFGPQTRFLQWKRVSIFQHALFGLSLFSDRFSSKLNGTSLPASTFADHGFAMVLGGGLDVQVSPRLAIRAGQTDYLFTRISGFNSNNFRYSGGVVFRFGKR